MTTRWDWTGLSDKQSTDELIRTLNVRMPRATRAFADSQLGFLPVVNVYQFAQDGTVNASSVSQAYQAVKAAGGGIVFFPPGFFTIASDVDITGTSGVIFQGSGQNVTHLVMGANGINMFDLSSAAVRVQFRDLWIGAGAARPSGVGIRAIASGTPNSQLLLERVTLQNLPTPLYFDNVHQSALRAVRYIQTIASATVDPVFYMLSTVSLRLQDFETLCTVGTLPDDVLQVDSDCDTIVGDGIEISFFTPGGGAGIHLLNSVGGGSTGPRLVDFTDTYIEDAGLSGVLVDDCRIARFRGIHTANCAGSGYEITGGDNPTISDSDAYHNDQHGYLVTGGDRVKLDGNTATNNSQDADNTYDGINIDTTTGARIVGNTCGDFILATPPGQRYGLNIGVTTESLAVGFNDLRGNSTGALNNTSGGVNNQIANNVVA